MSHPQNSLIPNATVPRSHLPRGISTRQNLPRQASTPCPFHDVETARIELPSCREIFGSLAKAVSRPPTSSCRETRSVDDLDLFHGRSHGPSHSSIHSPNRPYDFGGCHFRIPRTTPTNPMLPTRKCKFADPDPDTYVSTPIAFAQDQHPGPKITAHRSGYKVSAAPCYPPHHSLVRISLTSHTTSLWNRWFHGSCPAIST